MAAKPLTTEAIALTEKKMDMSLDEIIKMSKNGRTKVDKQHRVSNKSQKISKKPAQDKFRKVQHYMDSRSSLRQGALAQRRSNFQGNHFPLVTEAARKAAVVPLRNSAYNRSRGTNWNKARVAAPAVQRRPVTGGLAQKPQQIQRQGNAAPKQRPQTLDSLFANMKEQRMRASSRQKPAVQRNGGGQHILPPWRRGRFGN